MISAVALASLACGTTEPLPPTATPLPPTPEPTVTPDPAAVLYSETVDLIMETAKATDSEMELIDEIKDICPYYYREIVNNTVADAEQAYKSYNYRLKNMPLPDGLSERQERADKILTMVLDLHERAHGARLGLEKHCLYPQSPTRKPTCTSIEREWPRYREDALGSDEWFAHAHEGKPDDLDFIFINGCRLSGYNLPRWEGTR